MKIWAYTLFKNEERFLWYSVMSVIEHVDKILLYDTGSTDNSVLIAEKIKEMFPEKVEFRKVGNVDANEFTKVYQKMLNKTDADWFLIVDGDEIWWDSSIKKVVKKINKEGNKFESIVVPTINLIGDMFHHQEEAAGKYKIAGRKGHIAIRGINRNIPGLSASKPHGTFGWTDEEGKMIQDRDKKKILFVEAPYIHSTHLRRSETREKDKEVIKRAKKYKYELGVPFPKDYYYPEVFFRKRPEIVDSVWERMDASFYLKALLETPLRKVKRKLFRGKTGY